MAERIRDVIEWLEGCDPEQSVAIDDGGLQLVILDENGEETGEYREIGGIPEGDDHLRVCCQCGELYFTENGVSHHYSADTSDNIDHDADGEHVPYGEERL